MDAGQQALLRAIEYQTEWLKLISTKLSQVIDGQKKALDSNPPAGRRTQFEGIARRQEEQMEELKRIASAIEKLNRDSVQRTDLFPGSRR